MPPAPVPQTSPQPAPITVPPVVESAPPMQPQPMQPSQYVPPIAPVGNGFPSNGDAPNYSAQPYEYAGKFPTSEVSMYSNEGLSYQQIQRKKELVRWREKDLISEKEFKEEMEKLLHQKKKK